MVRRGQSPSSFLVTRSDTQASLDHSPGRFPIPITISYPSPRLRPQGNTTRARLSRLMPGRLDARPIGNVDAGFGTQQSFIRAADVAS